MNGKGWRARPIQNKDKYDENWERIFKKGEKNEEDTKHPDDVNIYIYNGKRC